MRRIPGFDNNRGGGPVQWHIWDNRPPVWLMSYGHLGPKDYLESADSSEVSTNMAMILAINKLAKDRSWSTTEAEGYFFADGSSKFTIGVKLAEALGEEAAQPWVQRLFETGSGQELDLQRANLIYRNRCVYGVTVRVACEDSTLVEVMPGLQFVLEPGDQLRSYNGKVHHTVAKECLGDVLVLRETATLGQNVTLFLTKDNGTFLVGDPEWPLDYPLLDNEVARLTEFYRKEAISDTPTEEDVEYAAKSETEGKGEEKGASKKKRALTGSKSTSDSNISAVESPNSKTGTVTSSPQVA